MYLLSTDTVIEVPDPGTWFSAANYSRTISLKGLSHTNF